MKKIIYPIFAVVVFLVMQAIAGGLLGLIGLILSPETLNEVRTTGDPNALMTAVAPDALAWGIALSGIATVGIIALLKMIDWKNVLNIKTIRWGWGAVSIVAAICGIFALDILEEMMDLPNLMEDMFTDMANSVMGVLCIAIVGPVVEELVFREAFLGYMVRNGVNKWIAIIASALAFGIIHLNPAQVPFAAAMGFILGIIYYKTGNIVIPIILHVLNNSVAVWQMHVLGDAAKDFSMIEWLGGQGKSMILLCVCSFLCAALLTHFWRKYKKIDINQ